MKLARAITQKLEEYWLSLRIANMDIPAFHLLNDRTMSPNHSSCETLSGALRLYINLKGVGRDKVFHRGAERNIQSVIELLGDRPIDEYSSSDAASYRDYLLKKGLTTSTVKRNFAYIRSIFNLCIQEHGLDCKNAFSRVYLPDLHDRKNRRPIPEEGIEKIQQDCLIADDESRWLIALISDTGMRLSEAAGLHIDDIKLEGEEPHLDLKPHPWRTLKTGRRKREIPLVGASLWAARKIKTNASSSFAFPKYTSEKGTNFNSASAVLNKWSKQREPNSRELRSKFPDVLPILG